MSQNGLLFSLYLLTIMVTAAINGCTLKGETKTFLSDMSDKMMLDQLLNKSCYDKRIRPSEDMLENTDPLENIFKFILGEESIDKWLRHSGPRNDQYFIKEFRETIFALRYLCTGASEGCFSPSKHAFLPIMQYLLHTPTLLLLGTTVINISVLVLSLASPDESSLQYEVEFLVHQRWEDARLRFEHRYTGDHEHLNGIHHKEALWLPDTYFLKHGESRQIPTPSDIALRIFKDGTVHYTMRSRLNLQCKGNLKIFPFDHPACFFGIESISHEAHEILFNWSRIDPPLVFVPQYHSLNAYIIKNSTTTCDASVSNYEETRSSWRGNYSCIKADMIFKRDSSFYFSTVFIPGMLLVSSSFITFWLEWNAVPGRVMLGVTTMLNFFTTSNNFRSGLPVVANLTAMNVWDGVCMCFIYASLLEFVTVNYLGRKRPRSIRALCGTIGPRLLVTFLWPFQEPTKQEQDVSGVGNHDSSDCSVCPPNLCAHSVPIDGLKAMPSARRVAEDYLQPIKLAKTIDVLSRVVFPVAYVVFLIYFFVKFQEHDTQ